MAAVRLTARLYLDEDVRPLLAEILRDRGHDVVSATRVGQRGLTDETQLRTAIASQRTLVTHNIRDFVRLHVTFAHQHHGIIVSNQEPLSVILRRLLYFLSRETPASVQGRLFWLSHYEPPQ